MLIRDINLTGERLLIMSENRLAELFCEMAEHEGKTDVVR
jgi:hypothetical protein